MLGYECNCEGYYDLLWRYKSNLVGMVDCAGAKPGVQPSDGRRGVVKKHHAVGSSASDLGAELGLFEVQNLVLLNVWSCGTRVVLKTI
eukprot:5558546-Amphidinium_carterae.1